MAQIKSGKKHESIDSLMISDENELKEFQDDMIYKLMKNLTKYDKLEKKTN